MAVMRACMLFADRDPVPSVETPLHAIIPGRFVAHTHDIATLSLSDTPSARDHVKRAYGAGVAFLEYLRPGFPLAPAVLGPIADAWQLDLAVAETDGTLRAVTLEQADEREALGAWWRTKVINATNAAPETRAASTPELERVWGPARINRSEEHTSELQSH